MQNLWNLIENAKNGNEQACTELHKELVTPIFRYVFLRINHQETAEDLTQQTFIKGFNTLDRLHNSGKNPLAYFYTIARNLVIDHYRTRKTNDELTDVLINTIPESKPGPENSLITQEDNEHIKKLLSTLPPEQADALTMKYLLGLSNAEIAEKLQKNESAVRQTISRALKQLRTKAKRP